MNRTTVKIIRMSLRSFLSDYKHLSDYRKQKIIRGEVAEPFGIDYTELNNGPKSVSIDFLEHVKERYGINLIDFA